MKASGAVLVGGKSRRMGIDKPLIPIGGQRLIERVIGTLAQVVEEVLLVGQGAARLSWLGLPCIEDLLPGGPLAGIYTALAAARHPHCLIVACDMPFLDPPLLAYLLEQAPGWDVVVPYVDGHLEPLHAVYTRSCQEVVGEMLARGETCPLDLYPRVRTRYVGPEEIAGFPGGWRSFVNLNTPQELVQVWAPMGGPRQALARGAAGDGVIPIVLVTAILPDGKPPRGEASAEASAEATLAAWPSGSISEAPSGAENSPKGFAG